MSTDDLILEPIPSLLIESMRDIGYSFETALADIIDNSIAAGANTIRIETRTDPDISLCVIDNGAGLTPEALFESMRMGSADPNVARAATDLGRFGLGLKTASFSQCRKLTVVSKKGGHACGFTWNLDHVVKCNRWELMTVGESELAELSALIDARSGTVVIWENLDRLGVSSSNVSESERAFLRLVQEAKDHLALVFHRFMEHEKGYQKISILLNDGLIEPIDPFNSKHDATIIGPVEPVSEGVTVQSYTLPHQTKYASKSEYERYGLRGGYLKNQGIYLYRARRLIIFGTWFNLAKKTALTQLCRVKIDIDNNHDEDWKIDVKKVSAQLPEEVRDMVRNFINTFNAPSKRVYRRRGVKQVSDSLFPVWNSVTDNGHVSYRINRNHPLVIGATEELDEDDAKRFETLLRVIESGFPTESVFYEISKSGESIEAPKLAPDDIAEVSREIFATMKAGGREEDEIVAIMRSMNVFSDCWEQVITALGIEEA